MQKQLTKALCGAVLIGAAGSGLSACGDSTPAPPSVPTGAAAGSQTAQTAPQSLPSAAPKTPMQGAFVPIGADELAKITRTVPDCNLDSIDGKPAEGAVLDHATKAIFSGWSADGANHSVPAYVRLVLKGVRDYAVQTGTGYLRLDVAQSTKQPAFANSGYTVQADLSAVAPGQYSIVILQPAVGQTISCTPGKQVTVR